MYINELRLLLKRKSKPKARLRAFRDGLCLQAGTTNKYPPFFFVCNSLLLLKLGNLPLQLHDLEPLNINGVEQIRSKRRVVGVELFLDQRI